MGCQQSAPITIGVEQDKAKANEEPRHSLPTKKKALNGASVKSLMDDQKRSDTHGFTYQKNACALEYWEPLKLLGEGSISSIHLVRRRPHRVDIPYKERADIMRAAAKAASQEETVTDGDDVWALKSIIKDYVQNDAYLDEMRGEIYTMSRLSHPNIVTVKEAYERKRHIYLIMEYCRGGDLCGRTFEEPEAAVVIRKLLSAVAYLHRHNVVHRDLKLENIMFSEDPSKPDADIKIIDFGLATKFLSNQHKKMTAKVGTLYSMAPQVLQGVYDSKCDMWSIGVITYALLSGNKPFWGPPQDLPWVLRKRYMVDCIMKCDYTPMKGPLWDEISPEAKDFIDTLLQIDPKRRPTAAQTLSHPWIVKYQHNKPSIMPAQDKHYARREQMKRAAKVLLAENLLEDEIVKLKDVLLAQDPEENNQVTIEQFRKALQQTRLKSSHVPELLVVKGLDVDETIDYVSVLNGALDHKMKRQEEMIYNIFHGLDAGNAGDHAPVNGNNPLSRIHLRDLLCKEMKDAVPLSTIDHILNGIFSGDEQELITCQQILESIRRHGTERMDAIANSSRQGSSMGDSTSDVASAVDAEQLQDSSEDLATAQNTVIPGGNTEPSCVDEPMFVYDSESQSLRKYRGRDKDSDTLRALLSC